MVSLPASCCAGALAKLIAAVRSCGPPRGHLQASAGCTAKSIVAATAIMRPPPGVAPAGILYRDMYARDLSGTHVEMRCLRELVQHKLPRLAAHLDALACDMSILATGAGCCGCCGRGGGGGGGAVLWSVCCCCCARMRLLAGAQISPGRPRAASPLQAGLAYPCRLVPVPVLHEPAGGDGGARVGCAAARGDQGMLGCAPAPVCMPALGVWWPGLTTAAVPSWIHKTLQGRGARLQPCLNPWRYLPTCVLPSLPAGPQVLFRVALALLKLHEPLLLAQVGCSCLFPDGHGLRRIPLACTNDGDPRLLSRSVPAAFSRGVRNATHPLLLFIAGQPRRVAACGAGGGSRSVRSGHAHEGKLSLFYSKFTLTAC